jgi:UDP-N-acetyl-D-glucosamine dehydrogenase
VKGARVLILGLAYKAKFDDARESPIHKLIQKFEALGTKVEYRDPFVPVAPKTGEHAEYLGRHSVAATRSGHDSILLSTGHEACKAFDFSAFPIQVVWTRNAIPPARRLRKGYTT